MLGRIFVLLRQLGCNNSGDLTVYEKNSINTEKRNLIAGTMTSSLPPTFFLSRELLCSFRFIPE